MDAARNVAKLLLPSLLTPSDKSAIDAFQIDLSSRSHTLLFPRIALSSTFLVQFPHRLRGVLLHSVFRLSLLFRRELALLLQDCVDV